MPDTDVAAILNELIKVSKDDQKRFLEAERLVNDPELKHVFRRYSDECASAAKNFEACVVTAGGYPDNTGSATEAIHRELMQAKAKALPNEEKTVLEECDYGEDRTREVYEDVMKAQLPPAIKAVVEKQYAQMLEHHRFIRSQRDPNAPAG